VDPALLAAKPPADDRQVVELVETLARKVRERPDDARGWTLLARSMGAIGRFQESADAYAHLAKLVPGDAGILADYADALGMAQGRSLAGKPYQLAQEALRIDPAHPKALALAGTAALDDGDFAASVRHWERLAVALPADSPDRPQVLAVIAEVRERAAQAGKPLAKGSVVAGTPAPGAAAAGGRVTGSIAVAPEVAGRIKGDETLFVFARAEGGSRMPLAIVRTSARELPMQFALDDSQAMAPTMKLSGAKAVRIEARVSRSGNAQPQAGDVTGTSDVVKPGATGIRIVLDKVVP
jgi:cytochrome c-type biogenesis protein CcmH